MDIATRFAKHHLIGLGFWQAWQMVVLCTDAVVTSQAYQQGLTLAIVLATTIGYAVIMALSHVRSCAVLKGKAAIPAAAVSMSAGTFVLLLAPALTDPTLSLLALGVALTSVSYGNAALLFMWGELWSTLATGRVGRHLYFSYAFAFVLYFVAYFLPYPVGGFFCCLFPIASCVILSSCDNEPRRHQLGNPFKPERLQIVKAVGFVMVLSIIWGSSQNLVPQLLAPAQTSQFVAMGMLVAGVALGALALNLVVSSPESEAATLYRPIVPSMAAGLAALFMVPESWSFIGNGLLTMGIYCLDMFIMLMSTDIAFRARISTPIAFGIAVVSSRIGTFIGSFAIYAMPFSAADVAAHDGAVFSGTVLCLAALAFAGTLIFTQADLQHLYESPYESNTKDEGSAEFSLAKRCALVAESTGLTARETQVLELLVRGRTIQGICEELIIAQGTAKHHVSNIYRKLGVGDRRSVFDIVERAKPASHE